MNLTATTLFGGLNEADVLSRLRAVSAVTGDSTAEDAAEVFARVAFSGIAEPGDRMAGMLLTALGANGALDALIRRCDPERIMGLMGQTASGAALGIAFDEELVQLISAGLERWAPRLNAREAVAHLERAARFDTVLLTPAHAFWPQGLDDLELHAPHVLWARGTPELLATLPRSIAVVGARASTGYGEHVTMEAAAGLVDKGVTVVSGAAYGIDGMAHRSALASGGNTVAFLAGGVDRFYPSGHDALLHRIVASGVVLSELPCGASPTKWRFLQRNRLIAAASAATVVIEAGWRSGSLNTAGHASALGRPLGVVPGPVTSASSAGCHRLLRETDAILVTNAAEMFELLSLDIAPPAGERGEQENPEERRVIDALSSRTPRSAEDIARRAGLSVMQAQSVLGLCALTGRAVGGDNGWRRHGGGDPQKGG